MPPQTRTVDRETGQVDPRITVWVLEDRPAYAEQVRAILDATPDLRCPCTFESGEALLEHLNDNFAPEVLLADLGLPGMSGIEAIQRVRTLSPSTQVVVLTVHETKEHVFDAICAGAVGYLVKESKPEQIVQAAREVVNGAAPMSPQISRLVVEMFAQRSASRWDYKLTKREKEVLERITAGLDKAAIGRELFLSVHTVDTHFRNIYAKLHVNSRAGAVAKALRERIVR